MPARSPQKKISESSVSEISSPISKDNTKLVSDGLVLIDLKSKISAYKKQEEKYKDLINKQLETTPLSQNGKHRETTLPIVGSSNKILFRKQVAESESLVPNAVELLRKKLGKKAEQWIVKVEIVHDNAIEQLFTNGVLTENDVKELVSVKKTESLIVKIVDND